MEDFKEVTDKIEVPRNTGLEGFMHTLRTMLRKPLVQEIRIDARGTVTCRRYIRVDETERSVGVDFSELSPSAIARNTEVEEVLVQSGANAAVVLGGLLDMVAVAQLKPLAFLSGAGTVLWEWYQGSTGVLLQDRKTIHGYPVHTDRAIPDTALILVSGYGREAALVDARASYKIEMTPPTPPDSSVEVMI